MWDRAKLFSLWNWLPAFHVVAQTQHLPTASRRLHVSVSALSRTIKQLEAALGCELFVREGRGLSLNQRGRALQVIVDRAVAAFVGEIDQVAAAATPKLIRIAVAHSVSQQVVTPTMLAALSGVVPSLHGCDDEEALALTAAGDVELAIVAAGNASPRLRIERLGELACGVYCGVGHPLFTSSSTELGSHPFVARRNEDSIGPVSMYVDQEASALELCLSGQLLAVLPDVVGEGHVLRQRLRRLADAERPLTLFAVRHRDKRLVPELQAVVEALTTRLTAPAEQPSRWRMGDELLMHAEYDAALAAWRRAAATQHLEASERGQWGMRQLRVAILRRRWGEAAAHAHARVVRGWSVEARAEAAAWSALAECMRGRLQRGEKHLARALALLGESDASVSRRAWVAVHRAEGNLQLAAGRPDAAVHAYEAGEALCVALGDRWERSIALYNLGEANLLRGDFERAALLLDRAAHAKLEIGDRWGRIWMHHARAFLHFKRRQADESVREASLGLTVAVDIPDTQPLAMLYVLIGRAQLAIGDLDEAERAFHFADRAAQRAHVAAERVQAHVGLVDAHLRRGQVTDAARLTRRLRALARACASPHAHASALVACAAVETHRDRSSAAQRLLAEASRALPDPLTPYGYWFNVTTV